MKNVLLFLFICISITSKAQTIHLFEENILKLEVFEGKFQHSHGQVFRSELSSDVYGCWMKPVFIRIKLDTANSKLMLEGKVVCENQGNKKSDDDDFLFMVGSIKLDTIKKGDKQSTSLTFFQTETVMIRSANEFNIAIKITSPDDVLCFTTPKNSEEKSEGKKSYFPVDPAHFYEVGKLLNK
jgi:hypothetical protein